MPAIIHVTSGYNIYNKNQTPPHSATDMNDSLLLHCTDVLLWNKGLCTNRTDIGNV